MWQKGTWMVFTATGKDKLLQGVTDLTWEGHNRKVWGEETQTDIKVT